MTQSARAVQSCAIDGNGTVRSMRDVLILSVHLLVIMAKLLRRGGARAVAAESLLLKHQLLISNRSRMRAPNLTTVLRNYCRRAIHRRFSDKRLRARRRRCQHILVMQAGQDRFSKHECAHCQSMSGF